MNDRRRPTQGYSMQNVHGRLEEVQATPTDTGAEQLADETRGDVEVTMVSLPPAKDLAKATNITPKLGTPRETFSELATEVTILNNDALVQLAQFFQKLQDSEHSGLLKKIMLDSRNAGLMLKLTSVMHSGIMIIRGLQRKIGQEASKTGQLETRRDMESYIKAATESGETIESLSHAAAVVKERVASLIAQLSEEGDKVISTVPPELKAMGRQTDQDFAQIIKEHPDAFVVTAKEFISGFLKTTETAGRRILEDSQEGVSDFSAQLDGMGALYEEVASSKMLLEDFLINLTALLGRYERTFELSVHLIEMMPMKNLNLILDQLEPGALKMIEAQYRLARNKVNNGEMKLGDLPKEKAVAHLDLVLERIATAIAQQFTATGATQALAGNAKESTLSAPRLPKEVQQKKGQGGEALGKIKLTRRKV